MEVTLRKIAEDILSAYRVQYRVTEIPDIRYVYFWIQDMRAKFVKQKLEKISSFFVEDSTVQDLGLITLEDVADPEIYGIPEDRFLKRTEIDIPKTIDRNKMIGTFTYIYLGEAPKINSYTKLNREVPLISHSRAAVAGSGKFNQHSLFAFLHNDRMYLTSKFDYKDDITVLGIKGVFQNPILAGQIPDPTYGVNSPYPISMSIIEDLKRAVMQGTFEQHIQQIQQDPLAKDTNIIPPQLTGNVL